MRGKSREPVYEAVAIRGDGVIETLEGLLRLVFADLTLRYDFEKKFRISGEEFIKSLVRGTKRASAEQA